MDTETDMYDIRAAIASLCDIVSEMVIAAEAGTPPEAEWVTLAVQTLRRHKCDLGFS